MPITGPSIFFSSSFARLVARKARAATLHMVLPATRPKAEHMRPKLDDGLHIGAVRCVSVWDKRKAEAAKGWVPTGYGLISFRSCSRKGRSF